jgi:hypothetical protein
LEFRQVQSARENANSRRDAGAYRALEGLARWVVAWLEEFNFDQLRSNMFGTIAAPAAGAGLQGGVR